MGQIENETTLWKPSLNKVDKDKSLRDLNLKPLIHQEHSLSLSMITTAELEKPHPPPHTHTHTHAFQKVSSIKNVPDVTT